MLGKMGFGTMGRFWLGAAALCLSTLACSDGKPASPTDNDAGGGEAGAYAGSGAHAGHGGSEATSSSGADAGEAGAEAAGAAGEAGAGADASISGSIELVAILHTQGVHFNQAGAQVHRLLGLAGVLTGRGLRPQRPHAARLARG